MSAQVQAITWRHTDSDLNKSLTTALTTTDYRRRPDGTPLSSTDRTRITRGLGIATLFAVESARAGRLPALNETAGALPALNEMDTSLRLGNEVHGVLFSSRAHCYAVSTLGRTLLLYADPGLHTVYDAVTHDGDPAELKQGAYRTIGSAAGNTNEAGAIPLLLVGTVMVVATAAMALSACYMAQVSANVNDRKLTEDAFTQRMLTTQARAITVVSNHTEAERAAGHPIPYSPGELRLLDALLGTQRDLAQHTNTRLPDPFAGAVDSAKTAAERVVDIGTDVGLVAAAAGGLYLLTR
jgi:hypothetical protein